MLDEDLRAREDDALSAVVPAAAWPKVEAAAGFADFDGTTLIGSLDQVDDLLAGRAGTVVVPQAHPLPPGSREHAGKPPRASGLAPIAQHAVSSRIRP
jgi:hypothetical protein